jgi:hypothetical protein
MTVKEFEIQYALGSLSDDMKKELAYTKRTPKEILTKLSEDEDNNVRYWVANNPNTPIEALTILSKDKDYSIRYRVAYNTNTPKALSKLIKRT